MLLEFQRDFAAAIGVRAEGPMRVYRNTVLNSCVDAVRANYPVVARLLGDEMFDTVAAEFAGQCPPRQAVLALYGEAFPEWMEEQPWITEISYVAHVARVEWLYVEALFASDREALDMTAMRGVDDWHTLQLHLHPATRFDWLTTPAMSIWLSQAEDYSGELEFDWRAEGVLVTRPQLGVRTAALDAAGYRFLVGIGLGETVGSAAVTTADLYPETDIGSLFTSLVSAGAFAAKTHRSLP